MKKIGVIIVVIFAFISCRSDLQQAGDNNLIPPVLFESFIIEFGTLPEYDELRVPNGYVVIQNRGYAGKGILVYNRNNTSFQAFDMSCPHILPSECTSSLVLDNWPNISCGCGDEDVKYSVVSPYVEYMGEVYQLQEYKAELIAPFTLRISNY